MATRATGALTDIEKQAWNSMTACGLLVLLPAAAGQQAFVRARISDPLPTYCFDAQHNHLRMCESMELTTLAASSQGSAAAARNAAGAAASPPGAAVGAVGAVGAMRTVPRQERAVFKLFATSTPNSRGEDPRAGFVCHQTSTVTTVDLIRLIIDAVPPAMHARVLGHSPEQTLRRMGKRSLCGLYELVLRKWHPRKFDRGKV